MAMIKCPNCMEDISEKAKKCVHCGCELVEETKKICSECGEELEKDAAECSKCGCPVENVEGENHNSPQQVEVTGVKIKPHISKKVIIIAIVAIVAIIAAIFGTKYIQEKKAIEEAENYGKKLETLTYTMLNGAVDAESCGNLTKSVWYNCIYEEYDSTTDKYTRKNGWGSFYDDFNDALKNLFSDSSFKKKLESIEENQTQVNSLMKEMKNPPEEWSDAYEDLEEYYDAYLELTNLALNPTGSLSTFSSNFNSADTNVSNLYNKMKMYFD